jgi:hypothetical protein
LRQIKTFVNLVIGNAKVHKGKIAVLAVFFLLQFCLVRELFAAEPLFGVDIAVVMVPGARPMPSARSARCALSDLEEVSREQSLV